MKKLMFILAAVVMATAANAAYVDWKFGKDTSYNGYTVYAFDAANQATVLGALAAYDAAAQKTINGLILASAEVKKGNANAQGTDVGSATSLLLVGVNGAFGDGVAFQYGTLDISADVYTPPTPPPTEPATLAAFSNSGTVTPAGPGPGVPEPTSGLLLLMGGAMLALRRKQK